MRKTQLLRDRLAPSSIEAPKPKSTCTSSPGRASMRTTLPRASRVVQERRLAGGPSAPDRHSHSLSRFRRLLVAVLGRVRPSTGLCHVAERRAPWGAPGTNSFEPSDCQRWIDTFSGSGVGRSWTGAMTVSARSKRLRPLLVPATLSRSYHLR